MPSRVEKHADPSAHVADEASSSTTSLDEQLVDVMKEMTAQKRCRVYAMQGLLKEYYAVREKLRAELAVLQRENAAASKKYFDIRHEIVSGARDVTSEEVARISSLPSAKVEGDAAAAEKPAAEKKGVKIMDPVDQKQRSAIEEAAKSASGGIPNFWLTVLNNSEVVSGQITERDKDALSYLSNIEKSYVDGDPNSGVVLTFTFLPNEYFHNTTLTKIYRMEFDEDDGEQQISDVEGTPIDWKSSKQNLTVTIKQKKQRNKKTKEMRIVEREEPCDSFFKFFSPPKPHDEDEDGADEEEEDFYEQEMEMDVETGAALMEELVPRAAYYYTGESVEDTAKELMSRFGFDGNFDEEDEEEEEEDGAAAPKKMGRGRGGGAATANPPQQQECKQQ